MIFQRPNAEYLSGLEHPAAPQDIDQAIKKAFLKLDGEITDQGDRAIVGATFLSEAMSRLFSTHSGSCALVSYYHSDSQLLRVACTGDLRAVFGRRNAAGKWEATFLSIDRISSLTFNGRQEILNRQNQTGHNEDEVVRLHTDHPDEPKLVKDGSVLRLAVTLAFGDSRWNWSPQVQEEAQRRFFGPPLWEPLISPPYLTALPVVNTKKIEPENGEFLIMTSDGLWDHLTNEQAVDLVSRWLKTHDVTKEIVTPDLAQAPNAISVNVALNRRNPNPNIMAYMDLQAADEKQFIVLDDNAATHLARDALGESNEDMLCGRLTVHLPYSRNVR